MYRQNFYFCYLRQVSVWSKRQRKALTEYWVPKLQRERSSNNHLSGAKPTTTLTGQEEIKGFPLWAARRLQEQGHLRLLDKLLQIIYAQVNDVSLSNFRHEPTTTIVSN